MDGDIQAFPVSEVEHVNGMMTLVAKHPGMTLRDYFAGQALSGLLVWHERDWPTAVRAAYQAADFMLEVRTANEGTGEPAREQA